MKKEYDFSKGVRGKFYRPNAKFNVPVYLDGKVPVLFLDGHLATLPAAYVDGESGKPGSKWRALPPKD